MKITKRELQALIQEVIKESHTKADEEKLKKISKQLKKSTTMHKKQADDLDDIVGRSDDEKLKEIQGRTEEDGESFELDVRNYRLKDEYGEATVGYPKRYEDNLRVRKKLYNPLSINEFTMGVYLMNDVNDGKIKTKKELELAIDELASYYKKIRIREDPELTFLQKIGEEPIDTSTTHRPIDKDKIRTEFEKAMKRNKEHQEFKRRHRVTPGLTPGDKPKLYSYSENVVFKKSYVRQVIREEYEAVLDEKKKKACKPAKGKRFAKRVNGKCRSYGQAGKAKGGGDRIRPGTKKGDAYCARSAKIKKCKNPPCANDLSRKKWKCRGSKSMK
jgi:hypothetical protein